MEPFQTHKGKVVSINRSDIDTDVIIPQQFLKRIERDGFGRFLMYSWRYDSKGNPVENFPLNDPESSDSTILLTGRNFGCGSSRENAVWALQDYGFKVIIASSFANIFKINSSKNGILLIELPEEKIEKLIQLSKEHKDYELTVDLEKQELADNDGRKMAFSVDPLVRKKLLLGVDDISMVLEYEKAIEEFEQKRPFYASPVRG
ncbi:3-isopropylmalate dehydratase small subunit [Rossellomorea vietnamensis]|uniref:3-isopropylmalate dehydratase small subunit n=1 Tax=Rossellomorea vietnamensis TaxID=218284 RepID=A0A5D4LYT1_9BACI|nr:3-isopropylmalate dehydratase small subunit [Rossellomorea vietnamensis]TYR94854.1 3-isopropylmalate dehydratase small subunit [Rossellomorea vietnamensis]